MQLESLTLNLLLKLQEQIPHNEELEAEINKRQRGPAQGAQIAIDLVRSQRRKRPTRVYVRRTNARPPSWFDWDSYAKEYPERVSRSV